MISGDSVFKFRTHEFLGAILSKNSFRVLKEKILLKSICFRKFYRQNISCYAMKKTDE